MTNINEVVALLFERLYQPSGKGTVSLVPRSSSEPVKTSQLYSYKPPVAGRQDHAVGPHSHIIARKGFILKSRNEAFTESILDRFRPNEMKKINLKKKMDDIKDQAVGAAKKAGRFNDRVNNWIDTPADEY